MNTTTPQTPDDIEAMLPWYAAGTLNRSDALRVEKALTNDPELARRYALVRDELGETIVLNETLGAPSPGAMEKEMSSKARRVPRRPGNSTTRFLTSRRLMEISLFFLFLFNAGGG